MSPLRLFVAWYALLVGMILIGLDIARWTITGVFLLGVGCMVVWAWGIGAFTREFWYETDAFVDVDEPTGLDMLEREGRR